MYKVNAYIYKFRIIFYLYQLLYTGALEDYNKAIEYNPDLCDAYLNRANLLYKSLQNYE